MSAEQEPHAKPKSYLSVWCCNIVVLVLCLLAIASYFFGPVWQVNATYNLTREDFDAIISKIPLPDDFSINTADVIDENGEPISVSVSLSATQLCGSIFSSADQSVNAVIDTNVKNVLAQLTPTLSSLTPKLVKSVAKDLVTKKVHSNVCDFLNSRLGEGDEPYTDAKVQEKLTELGLTDEYIGEKTDAIIDEVFESGSNLDAVTDKVMSTVDEIYQDLQKNTEGKEEYQDFAGVELSEEDRGEIESTVRDTLAELAQEDGTIDPNAMIEALLLKALQGKGTDDESTGKAGGIALLAEEETATSSGGNLVDLLSRQINEWVNEDVRGIVVWVFRGMAALIFLSMLPWFYVAIKVIVKLCTKGNPTVKLALPIWLGWIFFLLLVAVPALALKFLPTMRNTLLGWGLGADILDRVLNLQLSISSISWITAIAALIVFAISIFYMVMRRKIKKERTAGAEPQTAEDEEAGDDYDEIA